MTHLPNGWTDVALGEVCEVNPKPRSLPGIDEEVAFLGMASVHVNGTTDPGELRRFGDVSKGYTQFERGDVLVAKITPCFENGKIAQADPRTPVAAGSTEFHVVRPREDVDARYVLHYLRQPWVRLAGERRMTGSGGQRRVPASFVATLPLPLPPLDEQRRIAAILDKADELRAKRRAASEQLESLTQVIFHDMFGDVDPSTSSWPSAKVGSFVSHFEAGKSLVAVADEDAAGPYRVLKVSAVTSWEYSPEESKAVPAGYVPPSAHVVRRNDLLFSRANTSALVGATAMVHDTPTNLLLSDKLWRFVFSDPGGADPYFVWALFRSRHVRDAVMRRATGTSGSMKNISQKKVLGIEVAWPPQDLRREFARRARLAQHNRLRTRDAAEGCDTLFASLQSRAFRGEL